MLYSTKKKTSNFIFCSRYAVVDTDVQKHLKEFRRNPTRKRMKILRDLGTLLGNEIDAKFDFSK